MNRLKPEKGFNQTVSRNLLKKAEPQRSQTGINISSLSRDDLERLAHELEIKQSELETTNQNLRKQIRDREKLVDSMAQRLLEAQEKERRIIGHTLHDQIGGTLTMLLLTVKHAKSTQDEDTKHTLEEIERMIDEAYQEVRALSHTLRPSILDDFGLLDALAWYIKGYQERTGIEVNYYCENVDDSLSPNINTVIYRIVQEALTNAFKYAKATSIDVSISLRNDKLTLIIEDFGCGIDPKLVATDGIGITGMQDLCELVDGNSVIDSSAGIGTRITCIIPNPTNLEA